MSTTTRNKVSTTPAAQSQQRGLIVIGAIVVAAVIGAIALISLSGFSAGGVDYASIPQSRGADGSFILGNPEAPVTIIEFADFACSACQAYESEMKRFINDYVATGRAKVEYRVFPTAGGQLSLFAGQLLECADQQRPGAFWEGHDKMYQYATSGRYTQEVGRTLANDLNLNYSRLLTCTNSATQAQTDINLGNNSGVSGTPAVMMRINNGPAQWITLGTTTYNRGGVPYSVLSNFVNSVSPQQ